MKKELFIFVLLMGVFLNNFVIADITGEAVSTNITGKATSQQLSMSIFIQMPGGIPSIDIISPKSNTYLKNESLLLNYSIVNGDYIWYNIDDTGNITINSSVYFNVSQGEHTIYLYSNNTNGTASSMINFIVNSSRFTILFGEYNGTNKGNSINFLDYTYEEIQALNGIVLENINYGKIIFNEQINITDDKIKTDNLLDLDSNIEISSNRVELNSGEISNFNTSSTIWLYNLSFTNPRILREGEICPASICTKESYSGGILKFNVTQFSVYSAEETPSGVPPSGGGGSSRGDSDEEYQNVTYEVETIISEVTINPEEILVSLKPGQTIIKELSLKNNYNESVRINIGSLGITEFVVINETEFELLPGEMKRIKLNFTLKENTPPDSYVGSIIIKSSKKIYQSIVILDVQSKESLFDVSVSINKENFPIFPGDYLFFRTNIYNVGAIKGVNATLKYLIKDLNGNIIFEDEEIHQIFNSYEKEGEIKIPKSLVFGKYVLSIKIDYEGKTAVASEQFEIRKKQTSLSFKIGIIILILLLILIILWIIGKREEKKKKKKE